MIESEITKKNLLLLLSTVIGESYKEPIDIYNKNFIGFFQANNSTDDILTYHQKCSLAIEYFQNCFEDYFKSVIIATSLIVDSNILEKDQIEYLMSLKGFILPIDHEILFREDDENYKKGIDYDDNHYLYDELISSFRFFSKCNCEDLLNLSSVCMESDVLRSRSGYVFFIIPTLNLIIYPHDEIGYGCLAINNSRSKKKGIEFIKGIKHQNGDWLYSINIECGPARTDN